MAIRVFEFMGPKSINVSSSLGCRGRSSKSRSKKDSLAHPENNSFNFEKVRLNQYTVDESVKFFVL